MDTLDQIRAPAKRAVEKFPVSPFHLEMAASSTRAGELRLESQGLLAEKSETPRFCSAYLRGTPAKCLLAFTMLWLSGMSITTLVLKLNWHIFLRCLPGCSFGFILVLMASYEVKRRESKNRKTQKLPSWALMALLHFLGLILLSLFEMTWLAFTLEVVGTALGCLGLCSWMADDFEQDDDHNRWRIAGWTLQISGLLVTWLGALPCLVQITWQVAVCSLPGICWFLFFAFDAWTDGVPRDIDVMFFIVLALPLLYFLALPLSGLWQWFTGMELAAYLCLCIGLCHWIWFGDSSDEENMFMRKFLVGFGVVICALHFGAFALTTKLSCNLVGPWCHCWPWVHFVPFGLFSFYCTVEGVFLLWHKIQASRTAMLTRIIVIGSLALAPVLLATDVETWQGGVEAPSIDPMTYLNVSMENWTHPYVEVKRHHLHWLQMPQPIWPSKNDLPDTSTRRTTFWLSYMFFKFCLAAAMAFLVLKCSCASSKQSRAGAESQDRMELQPLTEPEEAQGQKFDDRHRSVIFCAIFPIYLTLVIKVSCSAALFGQLTAKTGLAFEGYDLCLTCGLLWLVVQALALRASDFEAQYDSADVLLSMSFLLPFIGDGFDSLKDAMLGALALRSHLQLLRCLGLASLVYLVTFHAVLAWNESSRLHLEKAYLPVLFLKKQKPVEAEGAKAESADCYQKLQGFYRKVLVLLYEQAKPSRQWAMLLEDLPQGVLALVVSSVEGFQAFTVVVNMGVPIFRITMAWLLHDSIASQLADWFLEQALKASDAGQFALCDDFIAALHRLQGTSSAKMSDLWEHVRAKNKACCLEALQKLHDDQSRMSLRLFVALQHAGRGRESAEDGWKKISELFEKCTPGQILDATSSILCAASRSSRLVLPPRGLGFSAVMPILTSIREPQQLTNLEVHLGEQGIDFSGAKALGEQLGKLQQVTSLKLYLHSNYLGAEGGRALGEQLGKLQQITSLKLYLHSNYLGAEGGRALGEQLGKLQQITSLKLYLHSNYLGAEGGRALGEQLGKLQQITSLKLYLHSNYLGAEGGRALGEQLGKLQQITSLKLYLHSNYLGAEGGRALGEQLGKLQQITSLKLYLHSNYLGAEGGRALGEQLGKLQQITSLKLYLHSNYLGAEGGRALGEQLGKLQQITSLKLYLHSNYLGAEGGRALGEQLGKLQQITSLKLYLHSNYLGAEGGRALGEQLGKLQQITSLKLYLHSNYLGAEGGRALGEQLGKLQQITSLKLYLHSNYLGAEGGRALGEQLGKLQQITSLKLYLHSNYLGAEGGRALGEQLGKLQQITSLKLYLHSNYLGAEGGRALGEQLGKLQQITSLKLYLHSNYLGAEGGRALGEQLGKLQQITSLKLYLHSNYLGAEGGRALGEQLGKLQQITSLKLYLHSNYLGAEGGRALGEQLGKLQQITSLKLYLHSNYLGAEGGRALGEQLGKLQQITSLVLDLASNDLGSEGGRALGEQLGKLQQITSLKLYLHSNYLGAEGGRALGEQLGKLQQITSLVLDLASNDLGSEGGRALGEQLGKLQQITSLKLYLHSNYLGAEGGRALGEQLGKLQQITSLVLDLASNDLGSEGGRALGEQLGKLQQITSLELGLADNNLGPEGARALGEQLGKLQQITSLVLDLSFNNLGPEGARALADHLSDLVHLTEVKLGLWTGNGIDEEVRAEIRQRLQRSGRTVEVAA